MAFGILAVAGVICGVAGCVIGLLTRRSAQEDRRRVRHEADRAVEAAQCLVETAVGLQDQLRVRGDVLQAQLIEIEGASRRIGEAQAQQAVLASLNRSHLERELAKAQAELRRREAAT